MSKLRFGILSTGNIAKQFADGVAGSRRCVVSAVGSRSQTSADAFGEEHDVAHRHASYEAVLADDTVDAVYIGLPNTLHHEWTLKALAAGKHVLCEKPLANTLAEAEEMFDAAEKHGKLLVEAFMYRSHPLTKRVVQHVRDGDLGKLKLIRSSFCYRTTNTTPDTNIRFDPKLAGGALMDIGCYCLSFSRLIAGAEPTGFSVTGVRHESGVDEYVAGTLTFPEGVVATFACGMTLQADNAAQVSGEAGYVTVPVPWKPPASEAEYLLKTQTPPRQDAGGSPRRDGVGGVVGGRGSSGIRGGRAGAVVWDGGG